MTRQTLVLLLVLGLTARPQPSPAGQLSHSGADLSTGIRQVREGDLDGAVITLDAVVKQLAAQKGQAKDLARAYTYLAIAYVGLAQQEKAKAQFLEAWKTDRTLTLSPKEFPPGIIDFFQQAKKEAEEQANVGAGARAATPAPEPSQPPSRQPGPAAKEGGGSKLPLILLGGAALVGGGVAIAATGGQGNASPPDSQPDVCTGFSEQSSYSGDCGNRPPGTVCFVFADGYRWLIEDSVLRRASYGPCFGNTVEVGYGSRFQYHHILQTLLVKRTNP